MGDEPPNSTEGGEWDFQCRPAGTSSASLGAKMVPLRLAEARNALRPGSASDDKINDQGD